MDSYSYKHERFVRELIAASGVTTLEEAALQWYFSRFGREQNGKICQLCHERIKRFVVIENQNNHVFLTIGEQCYDKLLHYLNTRRVESVRLSERKTYVTNLRKYRKKNINASFLAWLSSETDLPASIAETLTIIKSLGYPPSVERAEELVRYYRTHRKFSLRGELLDMREMAFLAFIPKRALELPEYATLAEYDAIRAQFGAWKIEADAEAIRIHNEECRGWAKAEAILNGYADEYIPVPLAGASVRNDSGDYTEALRTYLREPRLWVSLMVEDVEVCLDLPREHMRSSLGRRYWTDASTALLQKTMPKEIRVVRGNGNWLIHDQDIGAWIVAAKTYEDEDAIKEAIRRAVTKKVDAKKRRQRNFFGRIYAVLDHKVRQSPDMYLKLSFKKVKHLGVCEWQAECNGKTYILHRDCEYAANLGAVYVRIVRDVASRCAVLVTRLYLDTGETAYRWYWKERHIVREGDRVFRRECVKHYVEEQTVLGIS